MSSPPPWLASKRALLNEVGCLRSSFYSWQSESKDASAIRKVRDRFLRPAKSLSAAALNCTFPKTHVVQVIDDPTSYIYGEAKGDFLAMEKRAFTKTPEEMDKYEAALRDLPNHEPLIKEGGVLCTASLRPSRRNTSTTS